MKKILSGLLLTIITFVSTSIIKGLPSTSTDWIVLLITLAGVIVVYLGQSFVFPSTSILGQVDSRDFYKASFIGIGNLLGTWAASAATSTVLDWKGLAFTSFALVSGYFVKQLNTQPEGTPPTK